jgi:DNA-binding LacI/PurR family transcriptional regulator
MAKLGMQLLLEVIEEKEPEEGPIVTEPTLVIRNSTASAQVSLKL